MDATNAVIVVKTEPKTYSKLPAFLVALVSHHYYLNFINAVN